MFEIIKFLLPVAAGMFIIGFVCNLGVRDKFSLFSENIASSIGLIFMFTMLIAYSPSASAFSSISNELYSGIPFFELLSDYSQTSQMLAMAFPDVIIEFMNVVILSITFDLVELVLPRSSTFKLFNMKYIFETVLLSLIAFAIFNYGIKNTAAYNSMTLIIGGLCSVTSIYVIVAKIASLFKKPNLADVLVTTGIVAILIAFRKSKIGSMISGAFLKAFVYLFGVMAIQRHFGNLADAASVFSSFILAFAPAAIVIAGILIMMSVVFRRK